jgi:hypothetical protein
MKIDYMTVAVTLLVLIVAKKVNVPVISDLLA